MGGKACGLAALRPSIARKQTIEIGSLTSAQGTKPQSSLKVYFGKTAASALATSSAHDASGAHAAYLAEPVRTLASAVAANAKPPRLPRMTTALLCTHVAPAALLLAATRARALARKACRQPTAAHS